jgi:hypothetical protein
MLVMGRNKSDRREAELSEPALDEPTLILIKAIRYLDELDKGRRDLTIRTLAEFVENCPSVVARRVIPSQAEISEAGFHEAKRLLSWLYDALHQTELEFSKDEFQNALGEAKRLQVELREAILRIETEVSAARLREARLQPRLRPLRMIRLHLDGLDRYHGAGALVITVGSIGMIVSSCLALAPIWVGFLAGALPTFMLTTLLHPEHA